MKPRLADFIRYVHVGVDGGPDDGRVDYACFCHLVACYRGVLEGGRGRPPAWRPGLEEEIAWLDRTNTPGYVLGLVEWEQ